MIIQKKYYMMVLVSITGIAFGMETEKKDIHPLIQTALRTQCQINRLIQEMKEEDEMKSISGGYYKIVVRRGPITSVEQVGIPKPKL